nr:ATP-binding protein [uncultured Ruegeria sp.]
MSDTTEFFPDPSVRHTPSVSRLLALALVALGLCFATFLNAVPSEWSIGLIVVGGSLAAAGSIVVFRGQLADRCARNAKSVMAAFVEKDLSPCLIADSQGNIQIINQAAVRRFGATQGQRLDHCLRSVFANPAALLLRLQSKVAQNGRAREDAVTLGSTIPVSVFGFGNGLYCWRFGLDESSHWEGLDIPVLTEGRNGSILQANSAAQALFGGQPETLDQAIAGDVPEPGSILQIKTGEGAVPGTFVQVSRSGMVRDLALLPLKIAPKSRTRMTFSDLPVPVLCLSPDGCILEANILANKLIGDIEPGVTNVVAIMQGLGQPVPDWLSRTVAGEDGPRSEFLKLTRKDKDIFIQVTLSRVLHEGQVCLIAVLNDATELKTLEAQFVQGQKMQAVGQLAGGVAHDFNNLLTAISGHCDLLLLRHDQNDPNYGDLVQINQNANRAAALVSQLLAFSRKQTLRPEALDLRDTISDLIHLLNRLVGEKIRLTLSHDPVLKPVRADKRQLEQVFMNLVVNARDAMPEGGEIRIETEVIEMSQPLRRDRATVPPGEYVTVKVIDSGVGIAADKLQKVFEPFYTTKRTGEGTGLGLSTVYGIVKQTGGFIFVDSAQGFGTEFTVFLPVSVAPAEPVLAQQDSRIPQNAKQGDGVVLLVEDEAPVRAFATRALRLKGYKVLEADSGEEALRLLEDSTLKVDAFVTDVVMPGLDGPTWVRKAMETRPDVSVIFMSGYTEGAFSGSGPEIARSTFLPKPFSLNQLTEAVFQQLN